MCGHSSAVRVGISHRRGLCLAMSLIARASILATTSIGDHQSRAVHPSQNCGQMYAGRETGARRPKVILKCGRSEDESGLHGALAGDMASRLVLV
jgi:hypothetical protein